MGKEIVAMQSALTWELWTAAKRWCRCKKCQPAAGLGRWTMLQWRWSQVCLI